ncbi:hypothetical protein OB919_18935 [Halobacteria archaeon AArc-curdl1]|uniref:MYXO-CTERM domain-containing protein n=1 Tax=Natronosalvus hydrolyticus TaxID=2979988 RepID=A0AAP2ZB83_9EURY|nr:hypothetical protein [Halobacteria archaeon AArc-curdl1]
MPDDEQHESETPLSERLVKGAVEKGMETPMRDPILEAVEEADETTPPAKRWIPAAGGLVSLGAVAGYLAGRGKLLERSTETSVDSEAEPDGDVELESMPETITTDETDETTDTDDGGRSLAKLLALAGGIVGAAVLWRRRQAADDEWEPIETFEPAVDTIESSFEGDESETEDAETDADTPTESEDMEKEEGTAGDETETDEAETTPGGTDEAN